MILTAVGRPLPTLRGALTATRNNSPSPLIGTLSSLQSVSFPGIQRMSDKVPFCCSCSKKIDVDEPFEGLSVVLLDIPWESENTWSTFAAYFFILHIPLSFGGLSLIAQVLHQSALDPLTMAVSTTTLQIAELLGALALLNYTVKPQHEFCSFFLGKLFSQKSWVKKTIVGILFLMALVLFTSILADKFVGPKDVNNPILKEILLHSPTSRSVCFFLYCVIAPLLEETIYRGFLLTSLASTMKWQNAVIISSCMFSVAHFSGENSLQLFVLGCILGSMYCWTGNLASSFTIHSVYNAAILLVTIMS
ncbi:uncharacterized protein [Typha angustifolia]|uniref:uncharacterized protein n=1 Tax=Typha angustifolia TaxID=59011 RepID=UPI003C2BB7AC